MDRWIRLSSVFNFRDLGGIPTVSGGVTRHGVVFRADNLGRLDVADKELFMALGVRTVIDLRRHAEVESMGRVPEWAGATWLHHHLEHELWDHDTYTESVGVARWLADRYAELLASGAPDIARVIALLSDVDSGPTVVHCVAGKDRTGLISALTLSLLDVSDEEIAADYALTELSEPAYTTWLRRTDPEAASKVQPAFYVQTPAQAMLLTLAELRSRWGSVYDYLSRHGVTEAHVASLRAGLVADAATG
nr:tyrosine-protein phosphatase [Allorhizocola rhizosphaerae]